MPDRATRHVLGLSGGRDSAALAVYLRNRVPEMEYFFCDTGSELPETYEYLDHLEGYLGKKIARLNSGANFDHWLSVYRGALPSPQMRWCTRQMKIKPFEGWIDGWVAERREKDPDFRYEVITYVALRADEPGRQGYISKREHISARFPFREEGIDKERVLRILDEAGVGLPAYYEWRTRSGCYFCFFQRKAEWVGLAERHPDLWDKAVAYEDKVNWGDTAMQDRQYTWSQGETLREILARSDEILAKHELALRQAKKARKDLPLIELLSDALDEDSDDQGCSVCHL
jgi:3'-phosphoadenosine 5'-phosphosulfate sulfotransferase (PAPS reductase)/FAD synthetase